MTVLCRSSRSMEVSVRASTAPISAVLEMKSRAASAMMHSGIGCLFSAPRQTVLERRSQLSIQRRPACISTIRSAAVLSETSLLRRSAGISSQRTMPPLSVEPSTTISGIPVFSGARAMSPIVPPRTKSIWRRQSTRSCLIQSLTRRSPRPSQVSTVSGQTLRAPARTRTSSLRLTSTSSTTAMRRQLTRRAPLPRRRSQSLSALARAWMPNTLPSAEPPRPVTMWLTMVRPMMKTASVPLLPCDWETRLIRSMSRC